MAKKVEKSDGGRVLAGMPYIDLFAGVGGFHCAMDSLGARCVFASEWDRHAAAVYEANHGIKPHGDITKIDENLIPAHAVICGGFPCQAFSISGKRLGFSDTRGTLFFDVARIAKKHNPAVLFLENVKNFAQHDKGKTLKTVEGVLAELGYTTFHQVLNAAEHGFATARKRIYIVAFRKDLGVDPKDGFSFPVPTKVATAVRECLTRGADAKSCLIDKEYAIYPARSKKSAISEALKKRPCEPLRVGSIGRGGQGNRIYSIDGPAITLSAYGGGCAAKTGAYLVGNEVRKLTPRECATVMGFPKTFKLDKNRNQAYKQFGNSVVVGVVEKIALEIENALVRAGVKSKDLIKK